MGGICGILNTDNSYKKEKLHDIVDRMNTAISHRGQDGSGLWIDEIDNIALGQCNLSGSDSTGLQNLPLCSLDNRFVFLLDGEIYNYRTLRKELQMLGYSFNDNTCSEVVLTSICEWGLDNALKKFHGKFAFALWEKESKTLYLVRDRLGEVPLYYGWIENCFVFGSELKSIKSYQAFSGIIDRNVLNTYLQSAYIPAPYSIYEGIYKLKQGQILSINKHLNNETKFKYYWNPKDIVNTNLHEPFQGSINEAVDELDRLLKVVIKEEMVTDVPCGAFLSGGIDTSTVVSIMHALSSKPLNTFTIGFQEAKYNEAENAKEIASFLGTNHNEYYVKPEEALDIIPSLMAIYDEPFADSSQIPTLLAAKMARKHVSVVLTGDGGDHIFGGFNRYIWVKEFWEKISLFPLPLRILIVKVIRNLPISSMNLFVKYLNNLIKKRNLHLLTVEKINKLIPYLLSKSIEEIYHNQVKCWKTDDLLLYDAKVLDNVVIDHNCWIDTKDFSQQMIYFDMMSNLPDDIMTKVGRACMSQSVETRSPLIDHTIVEFSWRLPFSMKVSKGKTKYILRKLLERYIPRDLFERPKQGFGVPVDEWIKGPLKIWAFDLLQEKKIQHEGFFNPNLVNKILNEHIKGKKNWKNQLWTILIFELWLKEQNYQ